MFDMRQFCRDGTARHMVVSPEDHDKLKRRMQNPTNGSLWMLQVQHTNSERITVLIPQTAVCGYFKSSLLGHANPMANAVPEPTLSRRRLDLNKSTNGRLWDSIPFCATVE